VSFQKYQQEDVSEIEENEDVSEIGDTKMVSSIHNDVEVSLCEQ